MKLMQKTARINLAVIGGVIVVGVILALVIKPADKPKPGVSYGIKQSACQVFTPLFGYQALAAGNVKQAKDQGIKNDTPKDMKVSSCAYVPAVPTPATTGQSARLVVQSPTTPHGVDINKDIFNGKLAKDGQKISGYGTDAYWDVSTGQLNVLKHDTWYVLNIGPAQASARQLDRTKQLADRILLGSKAQDQLPSGPPKATKQ